MLGPRQSALPSRGPAFNKHLAEQRCPELLAYLRRLEASLGRDDVHFKNEDLRFLPQMVEALNTADPSLQLARLEFGTGPRYGKLSRFVALLNRGMENGKRWHAILDDVAWRSSGGHRAAMSIQCARNAACIILVDSLPPRSRSARPDELRELVSRLSGRLNRIPRDSPARLHLRVVQAGAQWVQEGCSIFALSAVKKMAAQPAIHEMQERTLEDLRLGKCKDVVSVEESHVLPPSFLKHSTSARALHEYLQARARNGYPEVADERVNKKGQTLTQRYEAHQVTREDFLATRTWCNAIRQCLGMPIELITRTYGNSYEHKRIEFVRAAIAHIAPVGQHETLTPGESAS